MRTTDVAIIGAGPVGLFAGFYAGMRGLEAIVIDKMEIAGGQLSAVYPEKYIYDVPGHSKIKAGDLVDSLMDQLERFKESTTFSLNNAVLSIEKDNGIFTLVGSSETIQAKVIIIAGGNGAFSPRPLGIDNEESVKNIHYIVNDLSIFKNKNVAIFGGGDSAVDWSLMLEDIAKKVSIVHRRNKFRAHDHSVEVLEASTVDIYTPFVADSIVGSKVTIRNTEDESTKEIEVDDIICNYGFSSNLGPITDWGLNIEKRKIVVDSEQKTNVDGIFAIGDICTYPGKASLIVSGFGEAPTAINSSYKYINPDAIIGALHSSSAIGGK